MITTQKELRLPPAKIKIPKTIKVGLREFEIDLSDTSSPGANGKDAIKRLTKALREGVFVGLPNTENGQDS